MNQLIQIFKAGGVMMWPLLLLSLLAFYTIVDRLITYKAIRGSAKGLLDQTLEAVQSKDFDRASAILENKTGVMADCLRVGLEYRHLSMAQVERVIQEVGEEQFGQLEDKLPILDTTTTISPLIGLLGTLTGMIATFQAISASKNQGENNIILGGVGEALYATATGLTIAVICFIAYNYFASRQRSIISETELAVTKMLNVLSEIGAIGSSKDDMRLEEVSVGGHS